ncbi:hypothetical protein [Pedobacter miscanthi]|uniref:hypothetical protein n=1 Tax=Pedobacter miscanthi TaxID=2259170 RepID=UPI001314A56D|nr:hypothetical protein [Pedobacter miscanthi]
MTNREMENVRWKMEDGKRMMEEKQLRLAAGVKCLNVISGRRSPVTDPENKFR